MLIIYRWYSLRILRLIGDDARHSIDFEALADSYAGVDVSWRARPPASRHKCRHNAKVAAIAYAMISFSAKALLQSAERCDAPVATRYICFTPASKGLATRGFMKYAAESDASRRYRDVMGYRHDGRAEVIGRTSSARSYS